MSTRCQIGFYPSQHTKIENWEALIYRHSDGYPGKPDGSEYGVLVDIVPFLRWFAGARGMSDLEYCAARLLQWLANEYDKQTAKYEVGIGSKDSPFTGTLGHGICKDFHWDIAYFYKVYPGGVDVIRPYFNYDDDEAPIEFDKWKIIESISIERKKQSA